MQSKRSTEESTDRGVSPVIGVILMVAITVILAAVIAAFVLDIGPGSASPTASADVSYDGEGTINVEIQNGGDELDGIAAVNSDGEVIDTEEESINTGATPELDDLGSLDGEVTVYGYQGTVTDDGSGTIDDTDASVSLGSVDTDD